MRNALYFLTFLLLLISCKTKPFAPEMPSERTVVSQSDLKAKPILYFKHDRLDAAAYEEMIPLSQATEQYEIRDNQVYDLETNRPLDNVILQYRMSEDRARDVSLTNGKPQGPFHESRSTHADYIAMTYDTDGNIHDTVYVGNERFYIEHGSGNWTEYYLPALETADESLTVKATGRLTNNRKVGRWEYFNSDGSLDSTKTYTLEDDVDIRFPYCLFNTNEPCIE